jgi:peroxin-7
MVANSGQAGATPEQQVGGINETTLLGHEYAVRKIQWSPHRADALATASYDMTCRVYVLYKSVFSNVILTEIRWTTSPAPQMVHIQDTHTEFVVGCSWALYNQGVLASCGWDGRVNVYRV